MIVTSSKSPSTGPNNFRIPSAGRVFSTGASLTLNDVDVDDDFDEQDEFDDADMVLKGTAGRRGVGVEESLNIHKFIDHFRIRTNLMDA